LYVPVLGIFAEGLAFLRTVDAAQPEAFRLTIVQDVDGVAVDDGDDGAGEVSEGGRGKKKEGETCEQYARQACLSWDDEATGRFYFFEVTLVYPLRATDEQLTLYGGGFVSEKAGEGTGEPRTANRLPRP